MNIVQISSSKRQASGFSLLEILLAVAAIVVLTGIVMLILKVTA
ncbi:MAG: prepilin-type N-terminal cleavage/methylation domain-containing protein [bacterium]|nr:prepilin-type N-terminal cleavage/methylation domain-containing protein [bacterium]